MIEDKYNMIFPVTNEGSVVLTTLQHSEFYLSLLDFVCIIISSHNEGNKSLDTNDLKPYLEVTIKQSDAHYKALAN